MPILFLKRILPGYTLQQKGNLSFFSRGPKEPIFCVLPLWTSQKKAQELCTLQKDCPYLVYLKPSRFLFSTSRKLLLALQPLYFMKPTKNKSFLFYDRRYLKTLSGLYLLPLVSIQLITHFKKTILKSLEKDLFFPCRENTPFYFQGDTTHRLLTPPYLERLQKRKSLETAPSLRALRFFKKFLDR